MLTGRKSYGSADTLDQAKAAFRAEYLAWKGAELKANPCNNAEHG